jgi:[lysine-biosynthesis-protein LysW]--L-2-aminoadipate ligase
VRIALVTHHVTTTNLALAASAPPEADAFLLAPDDALRRLDASDSALGRLDVRQTLDGIEAGLSHLDRLEARGVVVLNGSLALRLAHDKRATASALAASSVPHPRTVAFFGEDGSPPIPFPFVLKPRFGSWGRDVLLCTDAPSLRGALAIMRSRPWFAATGAVAQELVRPRPPPRRRRRRGDRRGEWRTNVALGAARVPADPPPAACELALAAAAAALGADLAGVDLLPAGPGRYVVLEVNGAVDFSPEYDPGGDVHAAAMASLVRLLAERRARRPEVVAALSGRP